MDQGKSRDPRGPQQFDRRRARNASYGIVMGLLMGVLIGSLTGNLVLWIAIGFASGVAAGQTVDFDSLFRRRRGDK
ncbi:MAG: hypothetical protein ABI360_04020 [Allobranchiibius sp.]